MKFVNLVAVLVLTAAGPSFAQMHHASADHGAMHSEREVYDAEGLVNRIDAAKGVANISHGPIPAMGWPAMTMDLKLEKTSLAQGIKPGTKVKFKLKKVGPTDYVVTAIEAVK